ncbi:uncharacterized protein LOC115374041 isoform X2 [Myripristis murdjan]|uniref:uncharacterized protein LOC115374041 isoform X2 n=1 Tax=Myripristis murdjan TaxID=586833 RepID=UPI001175DC44|nr:uncharacterized protein LOC115374041 isoform X2 [Myripristis murdjan]
MNCPFNTNINSQLYTEEEALVIENVVKAAISAVVDAIFKTADAKVMNFQRMVAERDKEISRLELKLQQTENDLKAFVAQRGRFASVSGEEDSGCGRPCSESEMKNEHDVKVEFPSLGTRSPSSVSAECEDGRSAASSSQPISDSSDRAADSVSPASQATVPVVKKERPAIDSVFIKQEMCEQRLAGDEGSRPANGHGHSPVTKRKLTNAERQKRYREKCRATPEGLRAYKERERLSYMRNRVLISEMSEETKRQKRAAWRAAARRARDRKLIKKNVTELDHLAQVDPSKPWLLPHSTDTHKGPP